MARLHLVRGFCVYMIGSRGIKRTIGDSRICVDCSVLKPLPAFTVDNSASRGRSYRCRGCEAIRRKQNAEYHRRYRKENREKYIKGYKKWLAKNPEQYRANQAVATSIRSGVLKREPCVYCGTLPSHAHHEDYGKPLVVIWLCKDHHYTRHRRGFLTETL